MGAFLAGAILDPGWFNRETLDRVRATLLLTIVRVYFLSTVLLDRGVISSATFTALLLMAVASTMLTVPMVTPRLAKLRALVGKRG